MKRLKTWWTFLWRYGVWPWQYERDHRQLMELVDGLGDDQHAYH